MLRVTEVPRLRGPRAAAISDGGRARHELQAFGVQFGYFAMVAAASENVAPQVWHSNWLEGTSRVYVTVPMQSA
jgi:hypothetical protein